MVGYIGIVAGIRGTPAVEEKRIRDISAKIYRYKVYKKKRKVKPHFVSGSGIQKLIASLS